MPDNQLEDEYRFGFTKEQIIAEMVDHRGLIRDGAYVPTRREVATWPAPRLRWHLLGWWWESPSGLIPNDRQVAESVAVLEARPDADSDQIREIIAQAPPPSAGEEEASRAEGGSNERSEEGD